MIIIYHAANTLDANMIKGLLAQYNIESFIQGEYLQGGAGQLPAADLVTVSVINVHENEARKIVGAWEAAALIEEEPKINLVDGVLNADS
jgi:hypothetical protein